MARFAVCIPVYNGANFLSEALQSIAEQTIQDIQVIVSDNASTDETPHILASWAGRLNLRVIRRDSVMPMQDHFNALLDEVSSDAYMLLCHDDYLAAPDAIEKALAALDGYPDASAVYCDLVYVNEHRLALATRKFDRTGAFSIEEVGSQTLRSGRNCFGIPLAIRRRALADLRYDSQFYYTMDVDLSWAIGRYGAGFHIAEQLIANRYSGQNTTWSLLSKAKQEYIDLSIKYSGPPSTLERLRIAITCYAVGQAKRIFGAYERFRSWAG